jgi:hypothetical protein
LEIIRNEIALEVQVGVNIINSTSPKDMVSIEFCLNNERLTILPCASHPIRNLIVQPSDSKSIEILLPLILILFLKAKK